jgi:hypothetical protein
MHKDDKRKEAYIKRHERREDWSITGKDTSGFWSKHLLWNKDTVKASYDDIRQNFSSIFT